MNKFHEKRELNAHKIGAIALALLMAAFLPTLLAAPVHAVVSCTPVSPSDTKFGTSITAAVVATTGQMVMPPGGVDATGCDVGVYIGPSVTGVTVMTTVHDADKVGVFNDGGTATVTGSTVSNTGNHVGTTFSPNGVQTGIGVYFSCAGTGSIESSTIYNYQKGGITVRSLTGVTIKDNVVTGLGPVGFIAQNGIEAGFGSCGPTVTTSNVGNIIGNTVSGNIYTQGATKGYISTGILVEAPSGQSTGQLTSALHTTNIVFGNQGNVIVIVG